MRISIGEFAVQLAKSLGGKWKIETTETQITLSRGGGPDKLGSTIANMVLSPLAIFSWSLTGRLPVAHIYHSEEGYEINAKTLREDDPGLGPHSPIKIDRQNEELVIFAPGGEIFVLKARHDGTLVAFKR